MSLVISGGTVIDPGAGVRGALDVLIDGDRVAEVGEHIAAHAKPSERIDATGCLVVPGLIDMHVHLREPGYEYK